MDQRYGKLEESAAIERILQGFEVSKTERKSMAAQPHLIRCVMEKIGEVNSFISFTPPQIYQNGS